MSRVQIPVVAQDAAGNAVAGASVTIVNRQAGQAPVVYTTETGGTARSLPLTTAVNGRPPESWVDRASYLITVTAAAIGTDVLAWDAASGGDASVDAAWLSTALRPSQGAGAGTEALRAIGAGAGQVVAGNDLRLTDQRTPTDSSVGWAKTGVGVNGLADGAIGVHRAVAYFHTAGNKVVFDTVEYNYGATLDVGNSNIVVPFAGLWHVTATITVSGGDAIAGRLFIGGDEFDYAYAPAAPSAARELHFAGARAVGANTQIYLLFDAATSIVGGRGRTHLNAHCLGRI